MIDTSLAAKVSFVHLLSRLMMKPPRSSYHQLQIKLNYSLAVMIQSQPRPHNFDLS